MYVCRTLSYKGAAFATVEAPLEERMMVRLMLLIFCFYFGGMISLLWTILKIFIVYNVISHNIKNQCYV